MKAAKEKMDPANSDQKPVKKRPPTWREMHMDTSPEAEAILFKFWREAPAWRKLEMMEDLNRTVRQLAMIGLRDRHPEASEQELLRRLADILLGEDLAEEAYGPLDNAIKK